MRTPHQSRQLSQTFAARHHNNLAMDGSTIVGSPSASMFEKRSKIDRTFAYPDLVSYDSVDLMSYPLLQPSEAYSPLPLPPHINLQRASEPASPATIASTLSHTSSPSPVSTTRNQPTLEPSSTHDFLLFDDSLQPSSNVYPQRRFQGSHRRFGSGSSLASDTGSLHTSNPSAPYSFPVIAQQDSFGNPSYGNNYLMQPQLVGNEQIGLFDMAKPTSKNTPRQMLQPPITFGQNAMAVAQAIIQQHGHSDDEDAVPGLSPASRPSGIMGSSRPSVSSDGFRSPKSPRRTPDRAHDIPTQSTPRIFSQTNQLSPHTPNTSHMNEVRGMISDFPNLFQQAQREHSMTQVTAGNGLTRERSPFQVSSPYHQDNTTLYPVHMSTAHEQRIKQERDFAAAEMLRQQMESEAVNANTPKTISPKDAFLDYREAESHDHSAKFFDTASTDRNAMSNLGDIYQQAHFYPTVGDNDTEISFGSMATSRRESSSTSLHRTPSNTMPYTQQLSQLSTPQYSYSRTPLQNMTQPQTGEAFGPIHTESSFSVPAKSSKPAVAKANVGTYTCTFDGCGQRFSTSGKLQKHRRESHRHKTPADAVGFAMSPAAVAARNAQPGPHKCTRSNPSTGKSCNIVFSRPYDLTRHEDTIHNGGKEKVRCEICTDEKTFSRYDALVRHKRVKHGIVDRH